MNENIDLTKILEGCPKGTKFYHIVLGEVRFDEIQTEVYHPIRFLDNYDNNTGVTKNGIYNNNYNGECVIFPSKDQRDWSKFVKFWDKPKVKKFDINTLQPFDKILARNYSTENWTIEYYSYNNNKYGFIRGLVYNWNYVIPYNDETKHLIGTTKDCPEYYKWWEE